MAFPYNLSIAFYFLVLATIALAGDPDILSDYIIPQSINPDTIAGQFFTFTGLRNIHKLNLNGTKTAKIIKATQKEFPALNGQSVSVATIVYPPSGGINPLHTHPRSSELLMVLQGTLQVGFVDSKNKLFVQKLRPFDLFVFPKGLVHFQMNVGRRTAIAIGMFGSADAGAVKLAEGIFGCGINNNIIAQSFKTDVKTVAKIGRGFK